MNDRIKGLYQTHISTKSKDEKLLGQLDEFTHELEAYNPMCGDKFTLQLKLIAGVVEDARFEGYGCTISKASTAVLTETIIGKPITEIKPLLKDFLELIDEEGGRVPEEITKDDQILAFAAARDFPERKTCAALSWEELEGLINELN